MVSRKFRGCVHYCVTTVCYDALDISPLADLDVPHKRVLLFDPRERWVIGFIGRRTTARGERRAIRENRTRSLRSKFQSAPEQTLATTAPSPSCTRIADRAFERGLISFAVFR